MHTLPDMDRFSGTQNKYFKGIPKLIAITVAANNSTA